MIVFICTYI